MGREYRDPDWLEEQYHGKGLTQREIAEECEVSTSTIRRNMKRLQIQTREVKGENHGLYGKERSEEVKQKISDKLTGREFSEQSLQTSSDQTTNEQGKVWQLRAWTIRIGYTLRIMRDTNLLNEKFTIVTRSVKCASMTVQITHSKSTTLSLLGCSKTSKH